MILELQSRSLVNRVLEDSMICAYIAGDTASQESGDFAFMYLLLPGKQFNKASAAS